MSTAKIVSIFALSHHLPPELELFLLQSQWNGKRQRGCNAWDGSQRISTDIDGSNADLP